MRVWLGLFPRLVFFVFRMGVCACVASVCACVWSVCACVRVYGLSWGFTWRQTSCVQVVRKACVSSAHGKRLLYQSPGHMHKTHAQERL